MKQKKTRKEDSLKTRYLFKLGTNLIGIPIGLVTMSIIPRGLGVTAYGNFSFLSSFFSSTVSFVNLGTSDAFYTKLSKRPNDEALKKFYWNLVIILTLLLMAFVAVSVISGFQPKLWPDQLLKHIFMGLLFGYLYWYSQIILKIVDAYAVTREGELIRMAQKVLRLILLIPMFLLDWFTLDLFFIYNYVIMLFSIVGWIRILHKHDIRVFPKIKLDRKSLKGYASEFYNYSAPLIIYAFAGTFAEIFDRWILQQSGGSSEQGYYGLAYQVGTICFLFTSAMTPLIFREFSVAISKKDLNKTRDLFRRHIPMLYAIAAYLGIFISFQAENVGFIIAGEDFSGAYWSIVIMAIYPIHQTYGQLSGSLFLASDNTRLYRNIGVSIFAAGIPVSYILISDNELFGLDLGGIGLSIKMIAFQFIMVNIQLWYNTRYLKTRFMDYFIHQIYTIIFFAIAAYLSKVVTDIFLTDKIGNFIVCGIIYTIFVGVIAIVHPQIFSLSRAELKKYTYQLIRRIKH